ncbi:8581_t:CDS:1, partial [Funneliformis caledonium]
HITALENKNEELEYNVRRSQYSQNKTSSKNILAETNSVSNSRPSKEKDLDKKHKIYKKFYIKYQESSSEIKL